MVTVASLRMFLAARASTSIWRSRFWVSCRPTGASLMELAPGPRVALTLPERRRGIHERSGGELLRPDQLLLPLLPLRDEDLHLPGAIRLKAHRPHHGHHVRGSD